VRFGVASSVLSAIVTSNTATGSYNSMHDSFTPLGGMVPLINMLLGELVFGGLGTGIYSILLVAVVAVFLTGLMVGRTPEFLGKKIGPAENKAIMLYTLAMPIALLPLTAVAVMTKTGLAGLAVNTGAHGFTEIFFGYTSSFANNGQSFAGLNANTPFYNITTAIAMMFGRFALAIPALALAGMFASQINRPPSSGTLRTDSLAFGITLTATVLIVAGLSYFPALTLGPILEHLLSK
jgi:K+-transporting ATPase ATPase A chain